MSKKPTASPVTKRRDALTAAVKQRGRAVANIWYVFDPGRRKSRVLVGDLLYELFYATEGDPEVVLATYENASVEILVDGAPVTVQFGAIVTLRDGRRECRDVVAAPPRSDDAGALQLARKHTAAACLGAQYVAFTPATLDRLRQRTRNWARAVAALARCRDVALGVVEGLVLIRLGALQRQTLDELIGALAPQASAAVVVAATVSLLRQRALSADLDTQTWGQHTAVWKTPT